MAGEGMADAIPPPLTDMVGTMRGFGLQKFFFEFRVPGFYGLGGTMG